MKHNTQSLSPDVPELSLTPPVLLPDGREFKTWQPGLHFSRTLHVDQRHPQASDANPGTAALPFRTIGRAAELAQPGERVQVAAGLYREHVAPARGGAGPDRLISYEAAPGAEVIISGAEPLPEAWQRAATAPQSSGWVGLEGVAVWRMALDPAWFGPYNPFAIINLPRLATQDCFTPKPHMMATLLGRRGLVFQDGLPLRQVPKPADLAEGDGAYWVEWNGQALYVRPRGDVDPAAARFEITAREQAFAPRSYELGYIRVKGFTMECVADGFPWPQRAALSTMRGHHWIIEENTIRWANALGMDLGRSEVDMDAPELCGHHIVRRNRVFDCGICGIAGTGPLHAALIEENLIARCGWHRVEEYFECAGIKTHHNHDCLIRRNVLLDMIQASGIWMDYGNINSRCSQNLVIDTDSMFGGIFMEASQAPNMVDGNVIWGSTSNGIYQHDCDFLTVAHNLIAHAQRTGIRMQVCKGRIVFGRESTAVKNRVLNNIVVGCGEPVSISDPDNRSDGNLIASEPPFDLAAWQAATGWDAHSAVVELSAALDSATRELVLRATEPLPRVERIPELTHDYYDVPLDVEGVLPGPFAQLAVPTLPLRTLP